MAINRISCPECAAALKSAAGFKPGETVTCPKCETDFVVEDPDEEDERPKKKGKASSGGLTKKKPVKAAVEDDEEEDEEEDERPKKKKKKKKRSDDDQEWSYKNSWIRYAILTVLLIVMCVLGYMLYLKQQREARSALERETPSALEV